MLIREYIDQICRLTIKHPSPGNQSVPLCLNRMFPGTTYSPAVFFAPSLLPGPCFAPLATPWEACDAFLLPSTLPDGWEILKLDNADSRAANAAMDGARSCLVDRWMCWSGMAENLSLVIFGCLEETVGVPSDEVWRKFKLAAIRRRSWRVLARAPPPSALQWWDGPSGE